MKRRPTAAAVIARRALPILALAAAAILAVGCASGGASPSASSAGAPLPLEGTDWQLTDYVGPEGGSLPVPEGLAATALFDAGKVSGNTGCNQYVATYTLDGDKLTIGTPSMTAMACPAPQMALESAYTAALQKVATYAISGDVLELRTADGKAGLKYSSAAAPSLTKTRWVATMINNGTGATASVVAGSTVTIVFGDDLKVAGSGGCNDFNGTYTVNGAALDFGPLMSTKKACTDAAVSKQEADYFAALDKATNYAFNGQNLQLRAADNSLQVEYRSTLP